MSWRSVYLILAGVLAVITIPAHALALRLPWASRPRDAAAPGGQTQHVLVSRAFLLLINSMTLSSFALYAVVVNLIPLLTGRGLSPTAAAWALGLGGAGQVAGRLCYRPLLARTGVRGRMAAVMTTGAATVLLLAVLPGPAALLITVAVLTGTVRGMFTLLEATIVSDYWGPAGFASLNGIFSSPLTAATAIAPTVGAAIATASGGYPELFAVLAGSGLLSALLALAAGPQPGGQTVAGSSPVRESESG